MNAALLPAEALVASAALGDQAAWNAIVDRYAALVWAICFRFRLSYSDAADVSQTVWLHTVEKLDSLRDPAALPGWLATITRRECLKVASSAQQAPRSLDDSPLELPADEDRTAPDAELLAAERRAMIREAFAQLPETCQRLLALLVGDIPAPYAEISARLSIPVGSIGPTRARCLEKLRVSPVVTRWAASSQPERQGDDRHV